jgi:excisionase family DNA binding protein
VNNETINWDEIPDIITKEQLYRICHISKATALHLLHSGKIPCEQSGKKTRCYRIKKEDVQTYLEKRSIFPEAYSAPKGWYSGERKSVRKKTFKKMPLIIPEDMSDYYIDILSEYSDVITVRQIIEFTGYGKTAVNRWCAKGWLKRFMKGRANMVPKIFFIEFLCSAHFQGIRRKTDRHIKLLKSFRRWQATQTP